jgi:hypothetical protein
MLLDIVGRLTRMLRDLLWGSPVPPSQRQAGAPDLRLPSRDRLESVPGTSGGRAMATLVVVAARAASGV